MNDNITLRGWVGTEPTWGLTSNNSQFTRFRMSVADRHFDEGAKEWIESHTSWYSVSCYGKIAENVAQSVRKGQRIIVMGRLRINTFQRQDGSMGTGVDLRAVSVGHDLALGVGHWNLRRDEAPAATVPFRPSRVEGVGVVDPVTGEVDGPPDEDPFGAGVPPFEDGAEGEPDPEEERLSA